MRTERRSLSRRLLGGYAVLVYAFLYVPIITIVVFSFDQSRFPTLPITGWTLDWYRSAVSDVQLIDSLKNSLIVAPVAALLSTTIGLLGAHEIARRDFRGKGLILLVVVAPLIVPLIVFGLGLLLLFSVLDLNTGLMGAVIAHTVFGASLSTLIIYSRLQGFDESLMEAARDLGASPVRAFFEILLPLIIPALAASFLLSFTLSFDEFIVAWFVIGFDATLPIEIWGRLRYGIKPDINAIATIVLSISFALGILGQRLVVRMRENE